MRFLYIAPRYHTNQVPIIEGLLKKGHEVKFISQYEGKVENHEMLSPLVLGYSHSFLIFFDILTKMRILDKERGFLFRLKMGWPVKRALRREIVSFSPDVVITRERSVYSMVATSICRKVGVPILLYDQSPFWLDEIKDDFAHRLVKKLSPDRRMTPVLGMMGMVNEPKSMFVPFVMKPQVSPMEKTLGDYIRILEVGKYETRKNHMMMIDVFEKISKSHDARLTIIGECTSNEHKKYYAELQQHVKGLIDKYPKFSEKIELLTNLNFQDMDAQYRKADIFVIPSTDEPASVSQIEAMAYSLPTICSNQNGTACYVEDGVNGYHFLDGDTNSLYDCLERILEDERLRIRMGAESFRLINEKYQIENYLEGINKLLKM